MHTRGSCSYIFTFKALFLTAAMLNARVTYTFTDTLGWILIHNLYLMGNHFGNEVRKTYLTCNHFSWFSIIEGSLWLHKDKPSLSFLPSVLPSVSLFSISPPRLFSLPHKHTHKETHQSVVPSTNYSSYQSASQLRLRPHRAIGW